MMPPDARPAISWVGEIRPVALERARVVRGDEGTHGYLPERSAAFREELQMLWLAAGLTKGSRRLHGPLHVRVVLEGSGHRSDLDNYVKAILDAGSGLLWDDDSQVVQLVARFGAWGPGNRGRVVLDVWEIPDAEEQAS